MVEVERTVSVSWVQRFRKRWALKRGSFMPGERLEREHIGQKVTLPKEKTLPNYDATLAKLFLAPVQKRGPPEGPQTGTTP